MYASAMRGPACRVRVGLYFVLRVFGVLKCGMHRVAVWVYMRLIVLPGCICIALACGRVQ